MSSMFKKKGGLAFKPKIPSTRSRTFAPAPSTRSSRPADNDSSGVATEAPALDQPNIPSTIGINDEPTESEHLPARATQKPTPKVTKKSTNQIESSPSLPTRQEASASGRDALGDGEQTAGVVENEDTHASAPQPAENEKSSHLSGTKTHCVISPSDEASAPNDTQPSANLQLENQPTHSETTSLPQEPPAPVVGTLNSGSASASKSTTKARGRKRSAKPQDSVQGSEEVVVTRPIKRRRSSTQNGEAQRQVRFKQPNIGIGQDGVNGQSRKSRARSLTPENAEHEVVDLQKLTMADLTKDLHIGKKFSRHDELRDRERQARSKARLARAGSQAEDEAQQPDSQEGDQPSDKQDNRSASPAKPAQAAASGPQFRIVDGQIVVDQNSLVMDRHARAAAAQNGQDMETIEENDFTRLITSSSFLNNSKLRGPNIWSSEETERFYHALRMFGTDFEIISKMFPGKQRRHVKLKYNREERHCPERIHATVVGVKTTAIDIEEYKTLTGTEFETVESIEMEQRKIQEGYEAEQKRIADEQEEIMRKKREELFADMDNEGGAGKKKKGGKKKGKQQISYGLNGEPITTES